VDIHPRAKIEPVIDATAGSTPHVAAKLIEFQSLLIFGIAFNAFRTRG